MSKLLAVIVIVLASALGWPVWVHAQAEQTPENLLDEPADDEALPPDEQAPAPEAEAEDAPASRETDFNEENFRRSMELRDQALQRSPSLTTGSYSGGTGVDVLDDLPETSQKHLRAELREVIVRNGPWTPDQEGVLYPYEPSEAAQENASLEQREQAAWGELVARYHEREAAIHANAARSRAATVDGSMAGRDSPAQTGEPGRQGDNQSGESEKMAQVPGSGRAGQGRREAAQAAGEEGVSQNALELLTTRGQLPPGGAGTPSSSADAQSASAQLRIAEQSDPGAQAAREGQADRQAREQDIDLDSDDVIAIDDLEKVNLDKNGDSEGTTADRDL